MAKRSARNNAAGRFQVVQVPTQEPGHCWVTRTSVGPFIDTGTNVQFAEHGRLYISVDAVREMAMVSGLFEEYESTKDDTFDSGYSQGYLDAVKENHGAVIAAAVDRLAFITGQLGAVIAVEGEVSPEDGADTPPEQHVEPGVGDEDSGRLGDEQLGLDDGDLGPLDQPLVVEGPAGVSADRGYEALPRL